MNSDLTIDAKGLNCPLPILRAKKALSTMQSGQVLEVIATDPSSERDFQDFCRQTGNTLLHQEKPSDLWIRAMHVSLILYAEHEFNASTFTARVISSTGADIYSAITGAIGAALLLPDNGATYLLPVLIATAYLFAATVLMRRANFAPSTK